MKRWLISANSSIYNHYEAFKEFGYIDWKQTVKYSIGDIVYVYCARPIKKVMYKTKVTKVDKLFKDCTDDKDFWYDSRKYEEARSGKYVRLELIDYVDNDKLSLDELRSFGLKAAPQKPMKLDADLADYIDSFFCNCLFPDIPCEMDIVTDCYEGMKAVVEVNKYERNVIARRECIRKNGYRCKVCGLDFEELYGILGKGFIHVHHVIPISSIGKNYKIDCERDLVPVCPNCHAMLHRGKDGLVLSIEELKNKLKK